MKKIISWAMSCVGEGSELIDVVIKERAYWEGETA